MKISPRYTERQWRAAFAGSENWDAAINIVEDRIRGRWLDPAGRLLRDRHSGFAILVLDCVVLESLWGFMNGKAIPRGREDQVYRDILTGPRFRWTAALSDSFRLFVRNGVVHDAETRNGWLVGRTTPPTVVPQPDKAGGYRLNRTRFHRALQETFGDWIAELRAGDAGLRNKMRNRMNQIVARHAVSLAGGPVM